MALHEQSIGATDEWYTPPYVFDALGAQFDVDVAYPCDADPRVPASCFIRENSLEADWVGFVWMNPPFGGRNGLVPWLHKFFMHGNGIALVPDRTSAPWWQAFAPRADLVLFVAPKIRFLDRSGHPGRSPAQGTCLLACGPQACAALLLAEVNGLGTAFAPKFPHLPAKM